MEGGDRTYFSGFCLPEDLSFLLSTAAECLEEACFPAKEVESVKKRMLGGLEEEKTNTGAQGTVTLSRLLYDKGHVNYCNTTEERISMTKSVSRPQLLDFKKKIGKGGLILACAGDIEPSAALRAAEKAFGKLSPGTSRASDKQKNEKKPAAEESFIEIKDKASVDVYLGAPVFITYNHPIYLSFFVLAEMLGGGFTGHLMQTVRERDGLTYGTYASPAGFADEADGYLKIWATFSPSLYTKAVEALRREVEWFFKNGITAEALLRKQEELTGSYLVGLSTTRGLVQTLHNIAEQGKSLSYMDDYPNLIRELSVKDIQNAASLVPLSKLSLTAAGTLLR